MSKDDLHMSKLNIRKSIPSLSKTHIYVIKLLNFSSEKLNSNCILAENKLPKGYMPSTLEVTIKKKMLALGCI